MQLFFCTVYSIVILFQFVISINTKITVFNLWSNNSKHTEGGTDVCVYFSLVHLRVSRVILLQVYLLYVCDVSANE